MRAKTSGLCTAISATGPGPVPWARNTRSSGNRMSIRPCFRLLAAAKHCAKYLGRPVCPVVSVRIMRLSSLSFSSKAMAFGRAAARGFAAMSEPSCLIGGQCFCPTVLNAYDRVGIDIIGAQPPPARYRIEIRHRRVGGIAATFGDPTVQISALGIEFLHLRFGVEHPEIRRRIRP